MTMVKRIKNFILIEKDQYSVDVISISERAKYSIILFYAIVILLSSFIFNNPSEVLEGMKTITTAPSILFTDYIELANLGASFFNSGLLMIISLTMMRLNKVHMSGPVVAAIFITAGFGFFGKNIYNIWSILFGTYLYSRTQEDNFNKYIVLAFFGTALGPIVSQISFGFALNPITGIIFGNLAGIITGFIIIPLANHFVSFHQGFNLYNMGFTAGIVGTIFMSFFRSFGFDNTNPNILSSGNNLTFIIYFGIIFTTMIILGFILNGSTLNGYRRLLRNSGRLISDYVTMYGFGLTMINMGLLGMMAMFYVIIVGGELNGIVIGAVITVAGFGGYGKHIKNVTPIILGVYLASLFKIWDTNSVNYLIAALFGTALAPIAGMFGWPAGIAAGLIHSSVVMNLSYLHGGMNLYNNGFSCGIVAGVLVPLIASFRKER